MTQIIGFAGKKQSGKNTCCNFITMLSLIENGICKSARLTDVGEIEVTDIFGERGGDDWMLFQEPLINTTALIQDLNHCRMYALADTLKDIAINTLGLPRHKVYGTDEDKETHTQFLWENMPGVITPKDLNYLDFDGKCLAEYNLKDLRLVLHEEGPMTIREVLQYVGTDIFRKFYPSVWVDSFIRKVQIDRPKIALVCDVRFDNEIEILKQNGAIILGLTRDIFNSKDTHASEQVNLKLCNAIIDNMKLGIVEQNKAIYYALQELNCQHVTNLGI